MKNPGQMPFLFMVTDDHDNEKFFVKIAACFDYKFYQSEWMADPTLPKDYTFIPDVDLCESSHAFESETDALNFIKDWWKAQ